MGTLSFLKRILPDRIVAHLQAADHYFRGEPEIRLLRLLCPPSRVAVDVGANIGTYTYFLRRQARTVHAYEPHPDLARRLAQLFPDVSVHPIALSNRHGTMRLRVPLKDGQPLYGQGSVAQVFDGEETQDYDVPAAPLDCERLADVGFIKVDAEQHDLAVLQGALETIRQSRPNIITEVTPLLYPVPLPVQFSFLTDLGYGGWFRFRGCLRPFSAFDPETHANRAAFGSRFFMSSRVLFLPRENEHLMRRLAS